MSIENEIWAKCLKRVHTSSISARHGLIQCKIVHRYHLTKVRLAKFDTNVNPTCDRCLQLPATYIHMFWSCSSLSKFWHEVFNTISQIISLQISPSVLTALFGITLVPSVPQHQQNFIAFVTLIARRLILLKWKSPAPPTFHSWIRDILFYVNMEKVRCTLNGSMSSFRKTWDPFFTFLKSLNFPSVPE